MASGKKSSNSMRPVVKASGPAKGKTETKNAPAKPRDVPGSLLRDERKWKAEEAMRTLMRAEEHKKDKALMSDVQRLAKEQAEKLSGLCGKASK